MAKIQFELLSLLSLKSVIKHIYIDNIKYVYDVCVLFIRVVFVIVSHVFFMSLSFIWFSFHFATDEGTNGGGVHCTFVCNIIYYLHVYIRSCDKCEASMYT